MPVSLSTPARNRCAGLIAVAALASPVAAQQFEAGQIDLSLAARSGDGVDIGAGRIAAAGAWHLGGRFGVQVMAQSNGLGLTGAQDDTLRQDALRLIGFLDAGPALRLGLSATQIRGDYPTDEVALGLHARYLTPGLRIEGELTIPPTDDADGLLTGVVSIRQDLGADTTLRALLHRRSTDSEEDDLYAIVLGGEYRFDNGLFTFAEAYNTGNDDAFFDNTGGSLGLGYRIDDRGEVFAALTVKDGDGEPGRAVDGTGLTIGARWSIGGRNAADGLFAIDPLLDIARYGAY